MNGKTDRNTVPDLAGEYFMVTGSGKYFRNVILDPEDTSCIIELDDKGENYRILWGLCNGGRPTSELPSHLMNHEVKKIASNGAHRVIYHAHTTNIIALTFVLPLRDEVFTRELWEMATECPVVFPSGVGVVGWMVPGGRDIAVATSELMKKYDVAIWAHHGMFASGEDFDLTFGLMHTVEKSAEILVKTLSMSPTNYRPSHHRTSVILRKTSMWCCRNSSYTRRENDHVSRNQSQSRCIFHRLRRISSAVSVPGA